MNSKDVINELSKRLDISKKDAEIFLDHAVTQINQDLLNGERIHIPGIGTFDSKVSKKKTLYNPFKKQYMKVPPKAKAIFKVAESLKVKVKENES